MKKVLVALTTMLFLSACFGKPKKVDKKIESKHTISTKGVERVEISKPNKERVSLEKIDGQWKITKPIQVPVSNFHAKKMNAIFGEKILMDDLVLSKDKLEEYDLSSESAYKVSLFTKSGTSPTAEFYIGKETATKKGARRSYLKTMEGIAYRSKSEISAVVRAPISNLRSKLIFASKEKPTSISITPREGTAILFELVEKEWKMMTPKVESFKMDTIQVQQLVNAFTTIRASGFGDGKTDKEMDLDPPRSIVSAKVGTQNVKYEIGNPAKKVYYIRIVGEKHAYKITKGPGRVLAGDYLIFKERVEKTIPMEEIISFQLPGKARLNIVRKNKKWFAGKTELDSTKIAPLLGTFAKMRAVKWKHESIEDAGLKPPAGSVVLKTKGGSYRFDIGKVFKKDSSRFARWSDSKYVMEIPYFIWDRATRELNTLKLKEKK